MAWALLDDNFPNHPKAIAAGRLARDLFVCGLCYCRKYHTDGFIAKRAIPALGCGPDPKRDIEALLRVHLWQDVVGGYQVHGYQQMYADIDVKAKQDEAREKKRAAGRKGGQASWAARQRDGASSKTEAGASSSAEANSKQPASTSASAQRNGSDRSGSVHLVLGEKSEEGAAPPLDHWLGQLQEDYPQHRVTYGFMTSSCFFETFQKDPRPAVQVWDQMRSNLENQKNGHEWRVKGMVPKLEKWLEEGLWKQRHEETPVDQLVTGKTARTLSSAAEFVKGGRS